MEDKEKIIEYLVKKYGYESIKKKGYVVRRYPSTLNKRIEKAINHFLLFYDEDKSKLMQSQDKLNKYQKWVYDFVCKNGLEDKYKKECLKELII